MATEAAGQPGAEAPLRSIFSRWVWGAMALAISAIAVLFAVTVWQSWRISEESLRSTVDTDIAGLVDILASGGEAELQRRLADRTALASLEGRQPYYRLQRPGGAVLAGNLAEWPPLSPAVSEAAFIRTPDGLRLFGRATRLGPDLDLLVARTYDRDRAAIRELALAFAATAGGIVLVVWQIGRMAADRLRQRVAGISAALRAAEAGEPPQALASQPRDEIGELAGLSARAVARMANLARTHRHMSDHIAHEIRTPLTHLDARLVACLKRLDSAEDREAFARCRQDLRGVVAMLDSLLDIAASEARVGDRTGLAPVDLSGLIENLVELYQASAEEAGITLRSRITPGITLPGEAMQLTRLVSNLLDNALKYVPAGGTVEVSLDPGPVIAVRDDGPGIEPHLRPFVFERFRSGSTPAGASSHGLGLALARAIAARHDLVIGLAPSAQGAHFVVQPRALWARQENKG